jgi:hypothetical protein
VLRSGTAALHAAVALAAAAARASQCGYAGDADSGLSQKKAKAAGAGTPAAFIPPRSRHQVARPAMRGACGRERLGLAGGTATHRGAWGVAAETSLNGVTKAFNARQRDNLRRFAEKVFVAAAFEDDRARDVLADRRAA